MPISVSTSTDVFTQQDYSLWTYRRGLVAKEVDGVQAFPLQQFQTQSLVPALWEYVEADETTWGDREAGGHRQEYVCLSSQYFERRWEEELIVTEKTLSDVTFAHVLFL